MSSTNDSGDRIFIDSNVLVYAHDLDAGDTHRRAARTLRLPPPFTASKIDRFDRAGAFPLPGAE
jgi:hypothetical protein